MELLQKTGLIELVCKHKGNDVFSMQPLTALTFPMYLVFIFSFYNYSEKFNNLIIFLLIVIEITKTIRSLEGIATFYSISKGNNFLSPAMTWRMRCIVDSFYEYPSYICSALAEVPQVGKKLFEENGRFGFNVFLPGNVTCQNISKNNKCFQLSDGWYRINAHEFFPSLLPWRRLNQKVKHDEKISVVGKYDFNEKENIAIFFYKNMNKNYQQIKVGLESDLILAIMGFKYEST